MFCRRRYCRKIQENDIGIEELNKLIKQGGILLDVRSSQEYREGHLIGAINIPEYEIDKRIENEIQNKNTTIIIYCQYGSRSRKVYEKMKRKGYTNIYNLKGGLEMI